VNLITGNTVGIHLILPGTFISNNFNISYGLGRLTILPAPVQFTIATGSLTQTYDGAPKTVSVTAEPSDVEYTVTYNGSTTPPVNAGTYAVQVLPTDPNYVGTASATLVIQKATAQITIDPGTLTQVYSTTARTVSINVSPADVPFTVTYNGSATAPVNAGNYTVQVVVNTPNYQGMANATLVVQKAPATATTGIYVINRGQALPTFTATYSGFLGGQTASVVTSTTFTLSPNYTGQAGMYAIIVNATAANYIFTSVNGTLYVNPAGAGTKQVKPTFICFTNLNPPVNGFSKVAYFNYDNPNNSPVYIPVGPRNSVTATAFDGSQIPSLFLPGVSAPIAIPFNGSAITWQITSNKNNGTTGSIPANSSNTVCTSPGVKNLVMEEEVPELSPELRVYPNPSAGRVFLEFIGGDASGGSLEVYSALGVRCAVQPVSLADHLMELDLSAQGAGMYIIKFVTEGHLSSTRVIIE
jgi:hypothetical protein